MLTTHLVLFSFLDGASVAAAQSATTYTFTGPSTGTVGHATSDYTVTAVGKPSADVTITPSDGGNGGTFNPATVTLTGGVNNASATFTYKQFKAGTYTLSTSSGGALTDPSGISIDVAGAGLARKKPRKQWHILPNGVRVLATSERYVQLVARATAEEKREERREAEAVIATEPEAPEPEAPEPVEVAPVVEPPKPIRQGLLLGTVPEPPAVPPSDAALIAAEIEAGRAMALAAEHAKADALAIETARRIAEAQAIHEAALAQEALRQAQERARIIAEQQKAEDEIITVLLLRAA